MNVLDWLKGDYKSLGFTYKEHINAGHCPFVPGKILDEFYRLLRLVRISSNVPYASILLRELDDLCTVWTLKTEIQNVWFKFGNPLLI